MFTITPSVGFVTLAGFAGTSLILFAFAMNMAKRWKTTYLVYDCVNALGGVLMVIYAYLITSYPFLILNAVWVLVSIRGIVNSSRR